MSESVRLRLRPDLIRESIHFGRRLTHVVKDPVNGRFFHFDPREWSILELLNGQRTVADVVRSIRAVRGDEYLSVEGVMGFLAEARRNGLVLLRGGDRQRSFDPVKGERWSLISAKIPLLNPHRLLTAIGPHVHWLFSRSFLVAYVAVVLSAVLLVLGRFEDVIDRLPETRQWMTPGMLAAVLIAIAGCKVIHELAHALVAERFGVRVQECGVLMFLLMPCFYCDVSNGWMLRSPRKRILISAAGMLAELGLAAVATWAWWFSRSGPVEMLCAAVMVTCSINTLILNGNPLMRFDGYFVLVDAAGFPNLSSRARSWWREACRRWIWGLPESNSDDERGIGLAIYGAAAAIYRLIVLTGMIWAFHMAFESQGAGAVTALAAMMLAAGAVGSVVRGVAAPVTDPMLRRMVEPRRASVAGMLLVVLLAAAIFIPLPRSVEAEASVQAVDPVSIYVQTPGLLRRIRPEGERIEQGAELAVLENLPSQRGLLELESQRAVEASKLESARVRQTTDPDAGRAIPALIEGLAALDERVALLRREVNELTITAPVSGVVLPPPNVPETPRTNRRPGGWTGTPFDSRNAGGLLTRGSLLAQIAASDDHCVNAYVSQRQIERLAPGMQARIAIDGRADAALDAVVDEISTAPIDDLPREVVASGRIPTRPTGGETTIPLEPLFRVRLKLVDPKSPLAIGLLASVKIHVAPASAARQALDWIRDAFRTESP